VQQAQKKKGTLLVFASEWGPCAPVSEGEGSAENGKKKGKMNQGKGRSRHRKEKRGSPARICKRERVSQCTCERKGRVSEERKEDKD